jgi:hypothetical protein
VLNIIRTDRVWNQYRFGPELIAWRDEVIHVGGFDARPSLQEMVRRNRLIRNHVESRAWPLIDDILMSGENEVQSLVSLKRRFLCIRWNSPRFRASSGFRLDGYASYIEWPFASATHAVAMTATNQRVAVWNLHSAGANAFAMGANASTGMGPAAGHAIRPMQDGNMRVTFGSATANFAPAETTARGFSVGSRSDNTTIRGYRDGVRLPDVTGLTIVPGFTSRTLFIGASHTNASDIGQPLACAIPYAAIGAQLADLQERATYAGVRDAVAGMSYDAEEDEDD